MTDPSVNVSERVRQTVRSNPSSTISPSTRSVAAGLHSLGARQCPACGAYAPAHTSVCPECGESLQHRSKKIRCLRCGGQASSELTLCPHCGRELRPAPPRLLTWGVPAALALLMVFVLGTQWESGNPLAWARDTLRAGFTVVGERIEPEIVLVVTPIAPDRDIGPEDGPGAALAIESAYRAQIALEAAAVTPETVGAGGPAGDGSGDESGDGAGAEAGALVTLPSATPPETVAEAAPEVAPEMPTATLEPTATEPPPTATPVATPSVAPDAPEPNAQPESVNVEYEVQRGDTLVTIAAQHGVAVEELMEINDIGERDVFVIQPGQRLIIPVEATPTPELATATPAPTATPSMTPTSAATTRARSTATPAAPSRATPSSRGAGLRLDAPLLLSPEDGAEISCDEASALAWQRVPFVRDSDKYILHLGFVSGRSDDGEEQIVWILAQQRPVTTTEWELDGSLCGLASAQNDHQWRWWVEVVGDSEGRQVQVSPPSETWSFRWE